MAFFNINKSIVVFTFSLLAMSIVLSSAEDVCSLADDHVLCTQLAKHANNWKVGIDNILASSLVMTKKAESIPSLIDAHMPTQLQPVSKESIESTCKEAYDNVIYNLQESMKFVKNGDFGSLKTYLSAVSFSDCTDALGEFGVDLVEANQFSTEINKLASTLLAVADEKKQH
jgi:pectinesterase inhibitor-like protein